MTDDWQKLDADRGARLVETVNPALEPVPFNRDSTTVRTLALPFYRGYHLCEMTDLSAVPAARKYAICKGDDVTVITWTNQPIYDLNERLPITLNRDTVAAYVRFFFTYVRGRHGRFVIVETIDDIKWQIEPPLQGRKVMQDMLAPLMLIEQQGDGGFVLEGYMVFKDSLFKTRIHVRPDGMVSMSDEELKIEGMPILHDSAA